MKRRWSALAVCGFVIGAAALAVGGDADELNEKLEALQAAAERVIRDVPVTEEYEPHVGRGYRLEFFPVMDLTCGRPDYLPPTEGFLDENSEAPLFGWQAEEAPQALGTIEEVLELVRYSIAPEAWEEGGTITVLGQTLVSYQQPEINRQIGAYLDRLRERIHTCVTVEAMLVEVPAGLQRILGKRTATGLGADQERELWQALVAEEAEIAFLARATGLAGQRFLVWHGRQIAVTPDSDVEVAQESKTADPIVNIVKAGGCLSVRSSVGQGGGDTVLDLEFRVTHLEEEIRTRGTMEAGWLDMPALERVGYRTSIKVPSRTWALLGTARGEEDHALVMLVRATVLPPKGGAR
jgi:hypothetical protein